MHLDVDVDADAGAGSAGHRWTTRWRPR